MRKPIELPVHVVLASASRQRRRLLRQVVAEFETLCPEVDESARPGETAEELCSRLAAAKAQQVASRRPEALVIGADTLAECGGEIIGKPTDRAEAIRTLKRLTRHPHRVVSGLCVLAPDGRARSGVSAAEISMRTLSRAEIEEYVDREEVMGRAGAYGIRELDPNIESLRGSRSAVMGLPLERLTSILRSLYPQRGIL